ncbi:MAG: hypothetical protein ABJN34_04980 [Litoreibacter sp.]|uniref:hypothetical protein n=1 Tax=Litoreibacter sp. TaxID=1969459 RepID=UPI003297221A
MSKFKATLILVAGLALAGCATTTAPIEIRPGIGSDVDLDALRPPTGVTYNFILENAGAPVPIEMRLTSRRRGANNYTYNGQMVVSLPQAENLEEITKVLKGILGKSSIRVQGNQLFIPVGLTADNRFRSTKSDITGDVTRYTPHDCFAVLGTCRYKAIDSSGVAVSLISETTEENGVWRSRTKLDPRAKNPDLPNETRRSVFSIDKNGVLIDMYILRNSGAGRSEFAIKRK